MGQVDVAIVTAIRLEFDAVLQVDVGAAPGSTWEQQRSPSGLPIAFRSFSAAKENHRALRIAVACAADMGATALVNTLVPLVEWLRPRCIGMCGVCAGRRGKVQLGDVVAADRVYYHDTGKQLPEQTQQDLTTYKLRDDWKAELETMDPVARFGDEPWFRGRPLTREWREIRALVALRDGVSDPWDAIDPLLEPGAWKGIVETLRAQGHVTPPGRELTDAGRRFVDELLFKHEDALPDLSPAGALQPFRLHVAPIGSGTRVIEDERIWMFVSNAMRKTLGIEMEAAAVAETAHRQRHHQLDWIVMKGVMDFADHGRDDHFKQFAARASAECLLWFLRECVSIDTLNANRSGSYTYSGDCAGLVYKGDREPTELIVLWCSLFREFESRPLPFRDFVGHCVDNYLLCEVLGLGGTGVVFRAQHRVLGKEVAFKLFFPVHGAEGELLGAVKRAARALSSLQHRGIVALFDSGHLEAANAIAFYLVMELVEGEPLDTWSNRVGNRVGASRARVAVALEIASALHSAHTCSYIGELGFAETGLFHGDLKPSNILVRRTDDQPVVVDFMMPDLQRRITEQHESALAAREARFASQASVLFGTPGYMPPEQEARGVVLPASDVYSLGETLYGLFSSERYSGLLHPKLDHLLSDMTSKELRDRPTMLAVCDRLRTLLQDFELP